MEDASLDRFLDAASEENTTDGSDAATAAPDSSQRDTTEADASADMASDDTASTDTVTDDTVTDDTVTDDTVTEGTTETDGADGAEQEAPTPKHRTAVRAASEGPVDEAAPTIVYEREGAACASCGDVVQRRWQSTKGFHCEACKEW